MNFKVLSIIILFFYFTFFNIAYSTLNIDVTRGNANSTTMAIAPFVYNTNLEKEIGKNVVNIISDNLIRTGLFNLTIKSFHNIAVDSKALPISDTWRHIKAEVLLTGSLEEMPEDKVEVRFRLLDVPSGRQLMGKSLVFEIKNFRRAAHIISDNIYNRLTGEEGYFDTKIVYIAEMGSDLRLRKIAIMDQDGHNNVYLTDGSRFVLTPRFSPDSQKIVYMSYVDRKGRILMKDLHSGEEKILGDFDGINSAPRFSPDGKSVLISESLNGRTNIYRFNLKNNKITKLTNELSINTSASYSPDKKFIVFNSDRSGSQQLYVMNADGSNQHRISFGSGRYACPVWSPRGDWIAFTKMKFGKFYIGVMKTNGTGERLLAEGYLVEGPTWSSNGRLIIFTRQDNPANSKKNYYAGPRLCSIDLTGINERLINTPTYASAASWSTSLKY